MKEIKDLKKPEKSGVLSTSESYHFDEMKNALARLFLDGGIFDTIDDLFAEDIPRHERRKRTELIERAKKVIDHAVESKRKTLLPDIMDDDIEHCINNSSGLPLEKEFEIP